MAEVFIVYVGPSGHIVSKVEIGRMVFVYTEVSLGVCPRSLTQTKVDHFVITEEPLFTSLGVVVWATILLPKVLFI